jgi:hypothetical protein
MNPPVAFRNFANAPKNVVLKCALKMTALEMIFLAFVRLPEGSTTGYF